MTPCPCQLGDRENYLCQFCGGCFLCDHVYQGLSPAPVWKGRDGHLVEAVMGEQTLLERSI